MVIVLRQDVLLDLHDPGRCDARRVGSAQRPARVCAMVVAVPGTVGVTVRVGVPVAGVRMHGAVRMRVFIGVIRDGNAFDHGVALATAAGRAHGLLLARNSGDQVIAISLSRMSPPSTICSW